MITPEDVADLLPGDVVEFRHKHHPDVVLRGPVHVDRNGDLALGNQMLRFRTGAITASGPSATLTVVSRVPRPEPLYVNHDRDRPVQGDVVRFDGPGPEYVDNLTWVYDGQSWFSLHRTGWVPIMGGMPRGMFLLVDGTTGRAVPA